jgi:hypothetical protein
MNRNENLIQLLKQIDTPHNREQLANSKPENPLYNTVFWEANRFSDNYLMLKEAMRTNRSLDYYSPMLMSLAFSNELFFKCLILIDNSDVYNYLKRILILEDTSYQNYF